MNENDKILINAYLDGDTSDNEAKYVESLLETNNDAFEYANKLKIANNEFNIFFQKDFDEISKNLSQFISKKLEKKKTTKKFNLFKYNFSRNYALTATIFFAIGIAFNQSYIFDESKLNFNDSVVIVKAYKTRSSSLVLNDHIKKTLQLMLEEKKSNGELEYDGKKYFLKLEKRIETNKKYDCFNGTLISADKNQSLVLCQSLSDSSVQILKIN